MASFEHDARGRPKDKDFGVTSDELASRAFLVEAHCRRPGRTARSLQGCVTTDGLDSYQLLSQHVPLESHVLDLGCGDGPLLNTLVTEGHQPARLMGIDLSRRELMLARAHRLNPVRMLQADCSALPFRRAHFDCVTAHLVMMLLPQPQKTIDEVTRVLKPGGRFLATLGGGPKFCNGQNLLSVFLNVLEAYLKDSGRPSPHLNSRATAPDQISNLFPAQQWSSDWHYSTHYLERQASPFDAWELCTELYEFDLIARSERPILRETFLRMTKLGAHMTGPFAYFVDTLSIQKRVTPSRPAHDIPA